MRTAVIVVPLLLAGLLAVPAAADQPSTLYVSDIPNSNCSDSGPGSLTQPFCDIQTAANVVLPGQTVVVGPKQLDPTYNGDVQVKRSGTPDQPITFEAGLPWSSNGPETVIAPPLFSDRDVHGFTLDGVHDIKIEGFQIEGDTGAGVLVSNSSDITIDHNRTSDIPALGDGIDVTGSSHDVTISRNGLFSNLTTVSIAPGASGVTIAQNILDTGNGTDLVLNGASGTAVTNNTSEGVCPANGYVIEGGSTGTSIENNIVTYSCLTTPVIDVAADSAATTTLDYNIVATMRQAQAPYQWAGTNYATAAALNAATGQAAHDLSADPLLDLHFMPEENSPAVDSANAGAPGMLSTDYFGNAREDDPLVANPGAGFVDRGAVERQDPMTVHVGLSASQAPTGGTVTATLTSTQGWAPITGYTVNWADGTPPTNTTATTAPHVFNTTSPFDGVTATVTDALGHSTTSTQAGIAVVPPAPLVPKVTATSITPFQVQATVFNSTDSWNLTGFTCDFGDGSPSVPVSDISQPCPHTYATAGLHRVTVTVTDSGGNSATANTIVLVKAPGATPSPVHLSNGDGCAACRGGYRQIVRDAVAGVRTAVTTVGSHTAIPFVVTAPSSAARPHWCYPAVMCVTVA